MQNIVIYIYGFFLILFCLSPLQAQQKQASDSIRIVVKSTIKDNAVLLRWAVTDKMAWKYGNTHGYILERVTVSRDGIVLERPQTEVLGGGPIKPKPMEAWRNVVETNDMAAVAAQAIYGKSFEVEESDSKLMQIVYESEDLNKRFGFALFAIDQSFEAALYSGLGYIDKTIRPNEKYLYRVKPATPASLMPIASSGVFLYSTKEQPLPKPRGMQGFYYKNAFVLIWEYDGMQEVYTIYDLERSEDGTNYTKINKYPLTKLADTNKSGISYTDSVPEFNKKYWYRVKGRTTFDQIGPSSKTVELIGFEELVSVPQFVESQLINNKTVRLGWKIAENEAWKVKKFQLLRSNRVLGPYKVVIDSLSPKRRNIQYNNLEPINYFKLAAFGQVNEERLSSPTMVQPVDSVPPKKPIGLTGTIDTLGVVRLQWEANEELDLMGYKIFRAETKNQEFTMLNKNAIEVAHYKDSVAVKTLTEKVYYRIAALDYRYNQSVYSDTLVLKRPDKIPPLAPVFTDYKIHPHGVEMTWAKSSSTDVRVERLYRKADASNAPWELIFETENREMNRFVDEKIEHHTAYSYTMVAVDQTNLESKPSPPLTIQTLKQLVKPGVKSLYATTDKENRFIQLNWRTNTPNILEIEVFKKKDEEKFGLFRTVDATAKQLIDNNIAPNNTYFYAFKIRYKDGTIGKWEEIKVVY